MSKKSLSKRRSRGEMPSAAVTSHLGNLADTVEKICSSSDIANISSCTAKILSLATAEGITGGSLFTLSIFKYLSRD